MFVLLLNAAHGAQNVPAPVSGAGTTAKPVPVTTTAAAAPAADEKPIELSPFTVNSADDQGYRAANTLSGSRLNSSLADTPGALDVLTAEFLADIGATNLGEALEFSANFAIDNGDFDSQNVGNSVFPGSQSGLSFRTRGLGGSLARNYLETDYRPAFYTIERIDNSSGPNAVLFGLGSAGGVANVTTKRAKLNRNAYGLDFQYDKYNSRRVTTDINRVLIPQKLGLRVNAIYEDSNRFRANFGEIIQGVHVAGTWRFGKGTEVRVEYEQSHTTGTVAYLGGNSVSTFLFNWLDRGSPVVALPSDWETLTGAQRTAIANPVGQPTSFVIGGAGIAPIVVQNGATSFITNGALSLYTAANTGFNQSVNQTLDPRFYTPRTNLQGPGGKKGIDRETIALAIDQKLTDSIYMNFSALREVGDAETYQAYGPGAASGSIVLADANATLTNGAQTRNLGTTQLRTDPVTGRTINPFAGQYYAQSRWNHRTEDRMRDVVQATVAGEFNLGKWFGKHRVVGTASYTDRSSRNLQTVDAWLFAPFNADPGNTGNQVFRRRYASPNDAQNYYVPDFREFEKLTWNHPTLGPITNGWVPISVGRTDIHQFSWVVAAQSRLINERLVVTTGYRVDDSYAYAYGDTRVRPPGWEATSGLLALDPTNIRKTQTKGPTRSIGGVFRATDWLRAYYNHSSNFGPPRGNVVGPDALTPPNTAGVGSDMGLRFALFNNKLDIDLNYYDTASNDVTEVLTLNTAVVGSGIRGAYNGIFPILNNPNPALSRPLFNSNDPAQVNALKAAYPALRPVYNANADLLDQASRGYEIRITANPMRGMRIRATASKTARERENLYQFTIPMVEQVQTYLADLQAKNPTVNIGALSLTPTPTTPVQTTIAEHVTTMVSTLNNNLENLSNNFGGGKLSANLVFSYDFQNRLKGLGTTLTARYNSGAYTGAYEIREGGVRTGKLIDTIPSFGQDVYNYGATVRYRTRINWLSRTNMTVRLSVNNLLNDSEPTIRRQSTSFIGTPGGPAPKASDFVTTTYFVRDPRSWTLAAEFDF